MIWAVGAAIAATAVPSGLRWLRVAQREHYLAGSATRFAWRWWIRDYANLALLALSVAAVIGTLWSPFSALLVAAAQVGPIGLRVRGSSSSLAWTARLRRLAIASGVLFLVVVVTGVVAGLAVLMAGALALLPILVDVALLVTAPLELLLGAKWVRKATRRLEAVGPLTVAITGSYGKTTTKVYLAHLIGEARRTVATPASFNNRMGLARSINEGLAPGTQVFIAEMGTYGPGEISDLCRWVKPAVAAIVAIGPVHLERFGTEERIVEAKAEILDDARTAVLVVDHPLLAGLAEARAGDIDVIEVSTGDRGRVRVVDGAVLVDGRLVADVPEGAFPSNLAAAIGLGMAVGVDVEEMVRRLPGLPNLEHRQSLTVSPSGVTIIDDTFNSNPEGASRALDLLATLGEGGVKAVVTPGMVELGSRQRPENEAFAAKAALVADHVVLVGHTNRDALIRGSELGSASVTVVGSREEAVAWVRAHLDRGDAVLYENDLPDHYP